MTCPDCEFGKYSYDKTCTGCTARGYARTPRGVLRGILAQVKKEMSAEEFADLQAQMKAWHDRDKEE